MYGMAEDIRSLESTTVIFLFTDIEGSTRLWREQPEAMHEALAQHHAILRESIEAHGGSVSQVIGDGFCAAFGTIHAALAAAIAAQHALDAAPWGATGPLRVRMALHAGPAAVQQDDAVSGRYASGLTLSHASRLLSAGHGGQVLLSAAARGLAIGALPDGAGLRDLGVHRLRDLPEPEHIYQLTAPGLADRFPPLRSGRAAAGNLPVPLTSFIGRDRELVDLAHSLEGARLLTLTGSGGTGKTRLALELARQQAEHFPDGAWLAELAAITDPNLLVQTVATALELREQPGRALLVTLRDALAATQSLLLLDNCEHLLDACAALVADLLQAAPSLKVLATSREPLGISGEVTYRVASLSLPESLSERSAEELMRSEAVRLLVERAQAVRPGFHLTGANAAAIARICQRLDGIPLAIELAATRVRMLSAEEIAARLDDYFGLLTGGSRSALPRQQTLRALIDWSHDLLSKPERMLLRRLSVFSGGWTLDAAEAVGSGRRHPEAQRWLPDEASRETVVPGWGQEGSGAMPGGDAPEDDPAAQIDVLETLGRLVDRSLVIADTPDFGRDDISPHPTAGTPDAGRNDISPYVAGATRYRLLEMIRQYAREKLLASGESAMIRDRHLAFFADLAAAAEPALLRSDQARWMARLGAELDNLRAAMAWAMGRQPIVALNLASHLSQFWTRRGLGTEGRRWLEDALEHVQDAPQPSEAEIERNRAQARGLTALGTVLLGLGDIEDAFQAGRHGLELARAASEALDFARALSWFALIAAMSGRHAQANAAAEELLALPGEQLDDLSASLLLGALAYLAANAEGDFGKAGAYMRESQERSRKGGDLWTQAMATFNLGVMAYRQGNYREAEARYLESRALWEGAGASRFAQMTTSGLADVARQTGDFSRSVSLYREMLAGWQQVGNVGAMARCIECMGFIAAARGDAAPGGETLWRHAARLLGAAEAMRETSSSPMAPEERAEYEQIAGQLLGADGSDPHPGVREAWGEGRAMTRAQAVHYALRNDGDRDVTQVPGQKAVAG